MIKLKKVSISDWSELNPGDVHIWILDISDIFCKFAWDLISDCEKARAEKFQFDWDRHKFTYRRYALRILLSLYLDVVPSEFLIKQSEFGKPHLDAMQPKFNLSHSHNKAVYAFSNDEIGVDIEWLGTRLDDVLELAKVFTSSEQVWLENTDPLNQEENFLSLWVQKEAYFKAIGTGLSQIEDKIYSPLDSGFREKTQIRSSFEYSFRTKLIDDISDYVLAVCTKGSVSRIHLLQMNELLLKSSTIRDFKESPLP